MLWHVRLPVPLARPRELGLGTALHHLTRRMRVPACGGCRRRAAWLDRRFRLSIGPLAVSRRRTSAEGECWRFTGSCTGFGSRQCVSGPARQEPDAELTTQCCGGWFQYPWIEVCPGEQQARTGCGFCFW